MKYCAWRRTRGTMIRSDQQTYRVQRRRSTNHLKLILPKLLLPRSVEKRKVADMMNEDVAQQGQLGIFWCDFASVRSERSAKTL